MTYKTQKMFQRSSTQNKKIKETEESIFKLEESLTNFKKDHFQDDFKYRNIGNIRNLFNGVALNGIDENYYKPIRTKSVLLMVITSNMKAKGTNINIYHLKNVLI